MRSIVFVLGLSLAIFYVVESNRYAEQLYEDLLYYYNKNVRPVKNASESIKVKFGASLIRIIDVDEVNQVLTTNLWLEMQWFDYKLSWDPARWGGIRKLHIPSDQIWIPDILLYNNADGEPHITIQSDALVYHNGLIVWKPPSIYKSFCPINIEYFPYDSQSCTLKFGGWSYNGFLLDVRQLPSAGSPIINREDESGKEYQYLEKGMDLSGFYQSLEWDLMSLTSQRHEQLYPGCCGQDFYIDVTFDIALRRKTLFYTVNLVIPCMLIAILTTFVFYIPPIEHKMTFSISILVSLTVFYLVLIELIPPTSLVIPLIGRYLLFTMFLVAMSILLSVLSLNYYRRDGSAHPMPHWMHAVFIETLPKYIGIKKAEEDEVSDRGSSTTELGQFLDSSRRPSPYFLTVPSTINEDDSKKTRGELNKMRLSQLAHLRGLHPDLIRRMIDNVSFIADHFRAMKKEDKISSDWSYVANVIDRLVLIIFTFVNLVGTVLIIQNSPMLFDHTEPMKIGSASRPLSGDTFESAFDANFTQESWWKNSGGL
uniref:ACR-8 n=1 Tax=Oesophagostomum dentatum TaxID=61180 RepID=L7MMZ7_OESDE|nr:nicotinic acetylcholine receptor alpha subunit 8 [Oesophagostomum dentatum]